MQVLSPAASDAESDDVASAEAADADDNEAFQSPDEAGSCLFTVVM